MSIPPNRAFTLSLTALLGVIAVYVYLISQTKHFNHDEFEHIHSAWYLLQGYMPYRDFFQSHNPLLWFVLAPIIAIVGENVQTVLASRYLMLAFSFGVCWMIYLITRQVSQHRNAGLLATILVLSHSVIVDKIIEIRPDVPQVFFGLVSIYLA